MEWGTLIWVGAIVLLFFVMMRGCGSMMRRMGGGVGCGMRRKRSDTETEKKQSLSNKKDVA